VRVPLNWLGDLVELDGSPDALAELLTNAGLEVKAIERFGVAGAELPWPADLVMAARILRVDRVPDADRLVLATVDYGADSTRQVITGAPNLFPYLDRDLGDADLWGALLLAGASYRNPYRSLKITRLKPKKLRGITSDAMLCSAVELGLGEDHEGIILFEPADELPALKPGRPLTEVLGDVVLDIDVIPNIARCASIMGVAREVAALTGTKFQPAAVPLTMDGPPIEGRVEIETENPELNPRFVALLIEGIEQGASPYWMQHRLQLAGQRPISNVVDISNYVMLEVGQPNHTFDYDLLRQRADGYAGNGPVRIVTRLARQGERLTTLDGAKRELRTNQIMVTDPAGSLSVGGVMGGQDSEIGPETRNVLLEAAAWERRGIRRTQRQLGVHTEAGFRFSRGVHPSQALLGARRAAELLRLHAGGTIAEGIIDHYPQPAPRVTVDFDLGYLRRLSGLDLGAAETADLLRRLEFEVEIEDDSADLRVTVPDHRLDIEGQHDLVEEVCRIYGYDRIPSTVLSDVLPPQRGNREQSFEDRIKDTLADLGLQEVVSYRLTTPEAEAKLHLEEAEPPPYIRLANPSTQDRVVMRRSLLASVLEAAASNGRFEDRLALFEVGRVFPVGEGEALPHERATLAALLTGPKRADHWRTSGDDGDGFDFFDIKGVVEALLDRLGLEVEFSMPEANGAAAFRPGRSAAVTLAGDAEPVGRLGEIHPAVAASFGLETMPERPILAAELELDRIRERVPHSLQVDAVPIYPEVREDLALIVDESTPAAAVEAALLAGGKPLLCAVDLFDVFRGEAIGEGSKSLAYHLTFRAPNRTLRDRDTKKLRRRILGQVERAVGARLRE
jgi:phenylalanyl-tRNA synthetase beta chain